MTESSVLLIGRILVAAIFIISGFGKLTAIGGTAGYFGSMGLPLPMVTAIVVGLVELLGGLALAIGYQTRIAALALAAFTFASAFVAHFDLADQMQFIQFMKNMAITGGFLFLSVRGAGALSLDAHRG